MCCFVSMRPSTVQTSVFLLNEIECRQVGAYGFTPMTFILPSVLWLVVRSLLHLRVKIGPSINHAAMERHGNAAPDYSRWLAIAISCQKYPGCHAC